MPPARTLAAELPQAAPGSEVRLEGWVHRRRVLATVTFLVVRDRSGLAQVVVRDRQALDRVQSRRRSSRLPAWPPTTRTRRAGSR